MRISRKDYEAVSDACKVLLSIRERETNNPEFERHMRNLPVPGGHDTTHFIHALAGLGQRMQRAVEG